MKNLAKPIALATFAAAFTVFAEEPTLIEENTDEIDLEEIDDSAEAAKQAKVTNSDATVAGPVSLVDIDCDEATLADILRQFRKTTGANIVTPESTNLNRRVSASLKRVPWLDALQSLLNTRGFRIEERGSIYFVNEDKQAIPILTKSFTLNHASSDELANLFNETFAPKDRAGKIISNIANSFPGANVVVVTAPEKTINECESIIKAVDKAVAQVYIEARFLELSSAALHKLGVDWSALESWRVSASAMKAGWEHNNGKAGVYPTSKSTSYYTPKNYVKTGNTSSSSKEETATKTSQSTSLSDTYTDMANGKSVTDYVTQNYISPINITDASAAGISASDMSWQNAYGFSGQLSAQDFSLAMSAFESLGEGKIFSNPKVIVSNGKEANIDMTTKYPNIRISSMRSTATPQSYTDYSAQLEEIRGDKDKGLFAGSAFFSWGIELTVKPRISPNGLISVEIVPAISQLDTDVTSDGFYKVGGSSPDDSSDVAYGNFPIIEMKKISTEFTMKDGSTAVIGGLSRTVEDDVDTGIPYLRKIPWIGPKLFGWKSRQKVQKEIIVCVTLGIANPGDLPKDMGLPKNAVIGREYVEGKRLEPGDRQGTAAEVLKIDTRTIEEIQKDPYKKKSENGSVKITVHQDN